jgi:hypothetical protein
MRSSTTVLAAGCVDRGAAARPSRSGAVCSSSQAGTAEAGLRIDPAVGVELVSLVLADTALAHQHSDEWTSVQTPAVASVLLPCLATPFALPTADVPTSLCEAALALLDHGDRSEADQLAEAARQMLAQHLVDSYLAVPLQPGGRWTLRDWLVMADLPTVVAEFQAAAWFNRLRLLSDESGADASADLLAGLGWSGAAAAVRHHPFAVGGALHTGGQLSS